MNHELKMRLVKQFSLIVNSAYGFPRAKPNNPKEAYDQFIKFIKKMSTNA